MAYSYQLLPEAQGDLDDAVAWYHGKSAKTAQRFLDSYLKAVGRITENPHQFPTVEGEIRKARLTSPFPYSIFLCYVAVTPWLLRFFTTSKTPKFGRKKGYKLSNEIIT